VQVSVQLQAPVPVSQYRIQCRFLADRIVHPLSSGSHADPSVNDDDAL
jgi:hypothetical protein